MWDSGTAPVDFTSEESLAGQFASAAVQGHINRLKELAKLVIAGPLGELDLSDKYGLDPRTGFKNCRSDALSPAFSLAGSRDDKSRVYSQIYSWPGDKEP